MDHWRAESKNCGSIVEINSWPSAKNIPILFSVISIQVWYREIIEEIIRYTRRRYLKDCSTLCRRLPGQEISITANFGSWNTNIDSPSLSLTQNSTLITTGSWNCYIDDLLRYHKISTLTAFKSWHIVAQKKSFPSWIPILGSSYT